MGDFFRDSRLTITKAGAGLRASKSTSPDIWEDLAHVN